VTEVVQRQDGPLWGAPGTPPPPRQDTAPPFPAYAPPPPAPRRLLPLYVGAAAVCVLGGILAVAILRYSGDTTTAAPTITAVPTTPPEPNVAVPGPRTETTPPSSPEWTPPVTTTTVPEDPLAGYQTVTGPAGVYVAIPADWTVKPGAVPSNLQADSPTADRLIRFGGSASTDMSLLDTVASNETSNPNIADGYQRIQLAPVPTLPVEAVDWEFTFVKDGVTKHSYGRYWRRDGIDYVVYASTTADLWPSMTEIVEVMVRTAGPI
jgi:hypothetical protein